MPNILRRYEELQSGRTAGWTCAVGLAAMLRAIRRDTGGIYPCSCVLEGEYGQKGLSMSVPVSLGKDGVREIQEWELASDEVEGVAHTAEVLGRSARIVDEYFDR